MHTLHAAYNTFAIPTRNDGGCVLTSPEMIFRQEGWEGRLDIRKAFSKFGLVESLEPFTDTH